MRKAEGKATDPASAEPPGTPVIPLGSARPGPITIDPVSEDLEFDTFDAPIDVFGHPLPGTEQRRPAFGQSQAPTAPPQRAPSAPQQRAQMAPEPARPQEAPRRADRAAFLAETARGRPLPPELLAQATRGKAPSSSNAVATVARTPGPGARAPDSALEFVDSLEPLIHSVAPRVGADSVSSGRGNLAGAGLRELEEAYAVGDYSRALQIAEQMLARSPDDASARRYAQNCRDVLTQMFAARLGPLDQVISVVVRPEEVQWLSLDHRAGFLLSLVDGQSTVDEILDISGMTRLDALKILHDLAEQQVVKLV
jgi:hypothetical protein